MSPEKRETGAGQTRGAGGGSGTGETSVKGSERPVPSFEQALGRIEEIVERLEEGELTLDESLKLFQEGVELSRRCQSVLDEAQRKIELLVRAADGTLRTETFEPDVPGEPDPSSEKA